MRKTLLIGLIGRAGVRSDAGLLRLSPRRPGQLQRRREAGGDQVAYIDLGQQILHGTWEGAVHYMPGLPAVIAVGQLLFGDPRLGIAVIQAVVYALVVVLAARLAARAFGDRTSVWAAAAVGLNPALGYYAAQALTEFLTAAACWRWCLSSSPGRAGGRWRAGRRWILVALISYLRSEYLGLAVLFALIVFWVERRRATASVALKQAGRPRRRHRAGHGTVGDPLHRRHRSPSPVQREPLLESDAHGHLVPCLRRADVRPAPNVADRDRARHARRGYSARGHDRAPPGAVAALHGAVARTV